MTPPYSRYACPVQASKLRMQVPRIGHSQRMQEQQLTSQATDQVAATAGHTEMGKNPSMRLSTVRIV